MANRLFNSLWHDVFAHPQMEARQLDYNEYWSERGVGKMRDRFRVMGDFIEEGDAVCDIGCGDGLCLAHLAETKQINATGIDISAEAIALAQKSLPNAALTAGNVMDQPDLIGEHDVIILSEVIEHLSNPEQMIEAVRGCYRKKLLVTIPNYSFYRYRLRSLFGRFPVQWVHHPSEHLRFWSVRDFRWWLDQLDFKVNQVVGTNGLSLFNLYRSQSLMNLTAWQVLFVIDPD